MRHFLSILLVLFFFSQHSISQSNEKNIVNQSLLIDAIREIQIGNKNKATEILADLKHEPECKGVSNYLLSKILKSEGKIEEAIEAINSAIFSEPQNTWYLKFKISLTEEYARDLETAIAYEKLSLLEEKQFSHYDNAALYFLKADDFKKALEILNRSEKVFGLLPQIVLKKSFAYCFIKKEKNALEILENGHSKFPTDPEIVIELINTLRAMNKNDQAQKYISKLKQIDPANPELIKFLSDSKSTTQNHENLNQIIESKDLSLDDKIKIIFLQLNQYAESYNKSGLTDLLKPAKSLKDQYPENSKTAALLADIYFQLNDLNNAKKEYIQSILYGTVPYSVWDNLLFCLIRLNYWKTAKYFSGKCVELYPNQSFPNYVNILSQYKLNELNGLLSQLNFLELIASHNIQKKTEVLILKAKILYSLNNTTESEKIWKEAIENDHDFLTTLEYCHFMASVNKSYPAEYFDKAMRSEFIHESFKADKAAEIYFYKKDFAKAKSHIDTSIRNGNDQSLETLDLAAKIYKALGITEIANYYTEQLTKLTEEDSIDAYRMITEPK